MEYDLCDEEQAEPEPIHPVVQASDQITRALLELDRDPASFVRWPFSDVHALTGAMAPRNIWFVCAASSGGKTTFIVSVVDLWIKDGIKVYAMPLETTAHDFRTYLACMATEIHPGDVLSGDLRSRMPESGIALESLRSAYRGQMQAPSIDRLRISEQEMIDLRGLEKGLKEAKEWGAQVVVIDHIDHISEETGGNGYEESRKINNAALSMAKRNDMLLVFTSQLNMSHSKGDYLTKYDPPKIEHVNYGQLKLRNATGMIGLYRPRRKIRPNESPEEFAAAMSAARKGGSPPTEALEPNCMGVVAMKLRNYGSREGQRAFLTVRHGKVTEMPEADRYSVAFPGAEPRRVL